jgi:hypothetical protein
MGGTDPNTNRAIIHVTKFGAGNRPKIDADIEKRANVIAATTYPTLLSQNAIETNKLHTMKSVYPGGPA